MSSDISKFEVILEDEAATTGLAKQFTRHLSAPLKVYFTGEIGAGKSCFIRAVLQSLGVTQKIKSPTFSMIETYQVNDMSLVHIDMYRINDEDEVNYLGLDEYDTASTIFFIEWPDKVPSLPSPDIHLFLESLNLGQNRKIVIQSESQRFEVKALEEVWSKLQGMK